MNKRRISIRIILILILLLATGCDGHLGVEGRVYEWIDAKPDDNSFVLIDQVDRVLPAELKPMKDIEIIVEPWTSSEKPADGKIAELWTQKVKTDGTGYFKSGATVKPGKYNATITVRGPKFKEVVHIFKHDRFRHSATVILVREE